VIQNEVPQRGFVQFRKNVAQFCIAGQYQCNRLNGAGPELGRAVSVLKPARAAVMASLAQRPVQLDSKPARSPIVSGAARRRGSVDLPVGYEAVDLFILDWLAAEALGGRADLAAPDAPAS